MSRAFVKEDRDAELPEGAEEEEELPGPPGKRYITPEGFERHREELSRLLKVDRPKITEEVSAAAAQGDRSENAEYIFGKKKLREIDRRIRYLTKLLERLTVVEAAPKVQQGKVFFGAWVTVEDEEGEESTYRIVGPDEFDVKQRKISMDAPLAKALLGKKLGDEVTVERPKGAVELPITRIRYD